MNMLLLIAVVVAVLNFILELLSVALPYWFKTGGVYYGLWEICRSVNNDDYVCRGFDNANIDIDAWYEAVEAMMLIALFFVMFAMILGICLITCLGDRGILYLVAAVCALFSALCSFIGIVIFGAKSEDEYNLEGDDLHAAFYLAIFGCCFAILTGILFFVSKPKAGHTQFA